MRKLLWGLAALVALAFAPGAAQAAARFAVCTVTCTWDAADTSMWSASSGGATGASVPGSGDTVTLDAATCVGGVTCTITVNATITVQSITMGACTASTTGCILDFSANDNNVTLSVAFSGTGTGTRTLNMGDGTWTLTATSGNVWDITTATNLTLNANASSIVLSATASSTRAMTLGGRTYNNISVSNAAVSTHLIDLAGAGAFTAANLTFTNVAHVRFPAATTITISGALTYNGSSTTQGIMYGTTGVTTISVAGANTLNWVGVQNITKSGAGSLTVNNGFNLGNNTSVTINIPAGGSGIIGGGL